jgi:hypothetical protein
MNLFASLADSYLSFFAFVDKNMTNEETLKEFLERHPRWVLENNLDNLKRI